MRRQGQYLQINTPKGFPESRLVTFRLGADAETECYVTMLHGGGALLDNLNRWRRQLGLGALRPAEVGDLEYVRVLGEDTPLFEGYGSYSGGMGDAPLADAGMLGVMRDLDGHAVFVKMIGPADEIAFFPPVTGG